MIVKLSVIKIIHDMKILDKMRTLSSLTPVRKWGLTKLIKVLNDEFNDLEAVRVDLVKKFGAPKENEAEGNYSVGPEHMDEFLSEIQTVLEKEITLPDFKLNPEEVADFTIDELLMMEDFIQE